MFRPAGAMISMKSFVSVLFPLACTSLKTGRMLTEEDPVTGNV